MIANHLQRFFNELGAVWEVIPSTLKVFFYASFSSAFGLWVADSLNWREVMIIVVTNLGLYSAPRGLNKVVKAL